MLLIPAIDLKDGHCVRLKQGDMDQATIFSEEPAAMARHWVDRGARRLHLVDLNGAFAGKPKMKNAIRAIIEEVGGQIPVQLGGRHSRPETIDAYLDDGLSYVIIGTAAVKNPASCRMRARLSAAISSSVWMQRRQGCHRRLEQADRHEVADLARKFEDYGCESIIYTDSAATACFRASHRSHSASRPRGEDSGDRERRFVEPRGHRVAVRSRGRRHRRRDLRPGDLLGRSGLRGCADPRGPAARIGRRLRLKARGVAVDSESTQQRTWNGLEAPDATARPEKRVKPLAGVFGTFPASGLTRRAAPAQRRS